MKRFVTDVERQMKHFVKEFVQVIYYFVMRGKRRRLGLSQIVGLAGHV